MCVDVSYCNRHATRCRTRYSETKNARRERVQFALFMDLYLLLFILLGAACPHDVSHLKTYFIERGSMAMMVTASL